MLHRILCQLQTGHWCPGQQLARDLGISPPALCKRIKQLVDLGCQIESGRQGYRLLREDLLTDHEDGFLRISPACDSTMAEALRMAGQNPKNGTMAIARHQTKARSHLAVPWPSYQGLYFSLVLTPDLPATMAGCVTAQGLLTMAGLLESAIGLEVRTVWPGSLVVQGQKIGGALTEIHGNPVRPGCFILGMGLHYRLTGAPLAPALPRPLAPAYPTGGLIDLGLAAPARLSLAQDFRQTMASWAQAPLTESSGWDRLSLLPGRKVWLEDRQGSIRQEACVGHDRQGGLLLESGSLSYGEARQVWPLD